MTQLTDYDDPKPDITKEERSLLRKAKASEELIQLCQVNIEEMQHIEGAIPTRHSVLQETKKYLRGTSVIGPQLTEENAREFVPYGGHFYTAMWDGDLFRAYSRADPNNKAIMEEQFTVQQINREKPQNATPVRV